MLSLLLPVFFPVFDFGLEFPRPLIPIDRSPGENQISGLWELKTGFSSRLIRAPGGLYPGTGPLNGPMVFGIWVRNPQKQRNRVGFHKGFLSRTALVLPSGVLKTGGFSQQIWLVFGTQKGAGAKKGRNTEVFHTCARSYRIKTPRVGW